MKLTTEKVEELNIGDYIGCTLECSCGKPHAIAMERIIVSEGAIKQTARVLKELGYQKALLVADTNTWEVAGKQTADVLKEADFSYQTCILTAEGGDLVPDERAVGTVLIQADREVDIIVSVGAGVLNDLGKFAAYKMGIDSIIVATAPSMDGFASTGAALIVNHLKTSYTCACPKAVIGDVDVLKAAPMSMIMAGWSDIMGKYSALADWRISHIVNGEYFCEATEKMVQKSIQTCMNHVEQIKLRDAAAIQNLMEGLILTGIAMSFVGNSRPASGSEHHLSHYWEMQFLFEHKKAVLHGTKVGVATTITTHLYKLLKNRTIDFTEAAKRLQEFSQTGWEEEVRKYYRECGNEIIAAAEKDGRNDSIQRQKRLKKIEVNWEQIQNVVAQVASPDEIRGILQQAGVPADPKEIDIDSHTVRAAILLAKEVRPRYTILGLLSDLGLLEEFAEQVVLNCHK